MAAHETCLRSERDNLLVCLLNRLAYSSGETSVPHRQTPNVSFQDETDTDRCFGDLALDHPKWGAVNGRQQPRAL